jgi:propanol-preferring alcohol dehydrogenase
MRAARTPLVLQELPRPAPQADQVLIEVEACAVCRTDLHLADGELEGISYPLIPGHQVVGTVIESRAASPRPGARVGVPWLGYTCGACRYCLSARENLCDLARFTGFTLPGGYAEYLVADARYCFAVDAGSAATAVAPLLCAGLIGYRALRMCGDAERIGLYGFGAAAHVLAQVLTYQHRMFYAFTRAGDHAAQAAAESLGARWAGDAEQCPPEPLDAAIIFAPAGELVPTSLRAVRKGGVVVCGGIHMSDIPSFPYSLLWGEREVRSVANLTRNDGVEFLELAARIPIETRVRSYPLHAANAALADLREGRLTGSAVLEVAPKHSAL